MPHHRLVIPLLPIALAAAFAASAAARPTAVTPKPVHRGEAVRVVVRTPSLGACLVETHYADGFSQTSSVKWARDGLVSWTVRIPPGAAFGRVRWTARCGVTWETSGAWRVVRATSG